ATLPPTGRFCPIAAVCCRAFAAQPEGLAKRIATRSGKRREQEMTLHNLRPVRALTLAAAISALAAPAASAIPVDDFIPATHGDAADRTQPVRVVQVEAETGFDWGEAGTGANGGVAPQGE